MKYSSIVLLWCISCCISEDIPNPKKEPQQCGNYDNLVFGSICDPHKYITHEQLSEEMSYIYKIQDQYRIKCEMNGRNIQIGVAILESYADSKSIREKAENIYYSWGVGSRYCDSGILLFLSIKYRKMHIVTGANIKNKITDKLAEGILERMKEELRNDNYHKAILIFLNSVDEIMKNYYSNKESKIGDLVTIFICCIIFVFLCYNKQKRKEHTDEILKSINQIKTYKENHESYKCNSCPICLKEFDGKQNMIILSCQHKYCEKCLNKYNGNGIRNCPICRSDAFANEDNHSDNNNSTSEAADKINSEIYFRLCSLNTIYPNSINQSTIKKWRSNDFKDDIIIIYETNNSNNRGRGYVGGGGSCSGGSCGGGGCCGASGGW